MVDISSTGVSTIKIQEQESRQATCKTTFVKIVWWKAERISPALENEPNWCSWLCSETESLEQMSGNNRVFLENIKTYIVHLCLQGVILVQQLAYRVCSNFRMMLSCLPLGWRAQMRCKKPERNQQTDALKPTQQQELRLHVELFVCLNHICRLGTVLKV